MGDVDLALDGIFTEEERPPTPEPTCEIYTPVKAGDVASDDSDASPDQISIRLVGSHPLWGHFLWNASKAFADYLNQHPELCRGRNVLELGAGGGLPGIVAAKNGASKVMLTDYPDDPLIANLLFNVDQNLQGTARSAVTVTGYIWGKQVDSLLAVLPQSEMFDLIIMSDLIFNHSQHDALLNTCDRTLRQSNESQSDNPPCILKFYSHHRPHLAHRDLGFFEMAKARGWECEEIVTRRFSPMFANDHGEEEMRATVHGWKLVRASRT